MIQAQIDAALTGGDILLIVPPFATAKHSVLGVHLLQALARQQGFQTDILYLNALLAAIMGIERFEKISISPFETLWRMEHERLFARSAYGLPPLGHAAEECLNETASLYGSADDRPPVFYGAPPLDLNELLQFEALCTEFVAEAVEAIAARRYAIVGCTARTGQTNCSVALLNGIKRRQPGVITMIGGTHCKGRLAQGIASLSRSIDYVFSGESETAFSEFLRQYAAGTLPEERVIPGTPLPDLDALPLPDYADFFEQTTRFLGEEALRETAASYETSRGCWWGAREGCHFCGEHEPARQKSPRIVLQDLEQMRQNPRISGVYMCDIAMPLSYHREVVPNFDNRPGELQIHYQAKANLSLRDLINLKQANIAQFTIGIEALSSGLLTAMHKGTASRDNLQLLRYGRSLGLHLSWLLLWGFPGDTRADYQETLDLLPLIRHFQPPLALLHLILTRFSRYVEQPQEFGVSSLRPWRVYHAIYPEWADMENVAYWFVGEYPCCAHEHPQLIERIAEEVARWNAEWERAYLVMIPFDAGYMIFDRRNASEIRQFAVEPENAEEIMRMARYAATEPQQWAVRERLGVARDGWYIPFVTASPELLLQFEENL